MTPPPAKDQPAGAPLRRAVLRGAVGLGLFAMLTAGIVAGTRALTAERIEANRLMNQHRQLLEVLPASLSGLGVQRLLDSEIRLPASQALGQDAPFTAWRARDADAAAVILPVIAPGGYSGNIELLVGVTERGTISGVRVTRHQETPGLGDAIEARKSDWIDDFTGRSLSKPGPDGWAVRKDGGEFDAFTGATITPRAVVTAVRRSLGYVRDHQTRLFGSASAARSAAEHHEGEAP